MAMRPDPHSMTGRTPRPGQGQSPALDQWASLSFDADHVERQVGAPPVPAFVQLSRLVEPQQEEPTDRLATTTADPNGRLTTGTGWHLRSTIVGRPLFRLGVVSLLAAGAVAIAVFVSPSDVLTTTGSDSNRNAEPTQDFRVGTTVAPVDPATTTDGQQAHGVLAALVRADGEDQADLAITAASSTMGDQITWTATIRNQGPAPAKGPISIMNNVGSGLELVSTTGDGWSCVHQSQAGTIMCRLDADLAIGQVHRVGLVTSNGGFEPGTRVGGTMSVEASTVDPDLDNNTINVSALSGGAGDENDDEVDGTGVTSELPRTGTGWTLGLVFLGAATAFAGRRMMAWGARMQTGAAPTRMAGVG